MNPQMMIENIIRNNPAIKNNPMFSNAYDLMQKNDANGLKAMAENIAKEKGVDLNALINQLKSNMRN